MKVLLCSPKGNTGGITRWTTSMLNYYSKNVQNVEMKWCYCSPSKRDILATTPIIIRIYYGLSNYLPFLKKLNKELKENTYDVVHFVSSAHLSLLRDIVTLKICKIRKVQSVIHFRFGRIPELYKKRNWEYRLIDYVVRHASKTIVIDQTSYNTLIHEGYCNVFFLPNPVSPQIFDIMEQNKQITRHQRLLLFAGHCVPTKGIFELIDACKQIPNIRLHMVGICDDNTKQDLYHRAGERSRDWLDIKGDQPYEEVIKEMLQCAVFVLPTYTEGFPNVIIESMACACPIITTPVGAIPELLDLNSDVPCGITVPIKNVEKLKNAIEEVLKNYDISLQMGKYAQQRVNKEYSMPVIWKKLVNIWNS